MDEQLMKIEENRGMIESICLGAFLKNLTSYKEYPLSTDDFMYDKTIFFFSLGKALSERYTELDEHTVLSFVKNNLTCCVPCEDKRILSVLKPNENPPSPSGTGGSVFLCTGGLSSQSTCSHLTGDTLDTNVQSFFKSVVTALILSCSFAVRG